MATKLDVYKSAVTFALDTQSVKDAKEFMKLSLQRFEDDGVGSPDFEFWLQTVQQTRNQMQSLSAQKAAPFAVRAPTPAPAPTPVPETETKS